MPGTRISRGKHFQLVSAIETTQVGEGSGGRGKLDKEIGNCYKTTEFEITQADPPEECGIFLMCILRCPIAMITSFHVLTVLLCV